MSVWVEKMVLDRPTTLRYEPDPRDQWLARPPTYGRSLYDKHDDGTGAHLFRLA